MDYAAEQGYTTFLYDRLGTGLSDHPDSIQMVQVPYQIEIAHQLIQLLRSGGIANQTFKHVVGVGHSYGSSQVYRVTAEYPKDFDAVVLTGFSADNTGVFVAFAGLDLTPAAQNQPYRFSGLSNGYLTTTGIQGTEFFFFRAGQFDPALLDLTETTKQTLSLGELFTIANPSVSPNFTGPVDIVCGENDLPNCHGNCLAPYNKLTAAISGMFPAAGNGSDWYIAPGTGHAVNYHYTAAGAYEHIHDFIRKNGF